MSNRANMLEAALASEIPDSRGWPRTAVGGSLLLEAPSPLGDRRIEIELRPDGDVDVRFHHRAFGGGSAEAHWPIPPAREVEVLRELARFAADLVTERIVVAFRRGWSGGRDFLTAAEVSPERRRGLNRVISSRGTYDWDAASADDTSRPAV